MKVSELIRKLKSLPQGLEVYTDFGLDMKYGKEAMPITYVDEVDCEGVATGEKKHAVMLSAFWQAGERELLESYHNGKD